jgi:hypothetical protein
MRLKHFVVVAILFTAGGIIYSVRSQMTPKSFPSFIVTEVMSSPAKNLPYPRTWTSARAVREDGSWVKIAIGIPPIQDERDIHDFRSGVHTIVDDTTKSVVRQNIPSDEYKHRLTPAASCNGTASGKILGLSVNYVEDTVQITGNPQGDATSLVKSWVVPDLGCFVLQKETIWTRNSDGVIVVDTKITPISVSFQPVDELFAIPNSYTERTKEDAWELFKQRTATPPL